jgi:acetyltransferase
MKALDAVQAAELVKCIAPLAKQKTVKTVAETAAFAKAYGYPLVLKAIAPKIVHKTEAGAIRVVHAEAQLEKEFVALKKLAPVVLAQEFVKGNEFILGLKKDPTFGHVVVAGIGGIYVEVYKDVSFRVCPITAKDAEQMLSELKGAKILEGARGKKLNKQALVDALVKLSRIPSSKSKHAISELDINPFILNEKEGKIVDARIVVE